MRPFRGRIDKASGFVGNETATASENNRAYTLAGLQRHIHVDKL